MAVFHPYFPFLFYIIRHPSHYYNIFLRKGSGKPMCVRGSRSLCGSITAMQTVKNHINKRSVQDAVSFFPIRHIPYKFSIISVFIVKILTFFIFSVYMILCKCYPEYCNFPKTNKDFPNNPKSDIQHRPPKLIPALKVSRIARTSPAHCAAPPIPAAV